MTPSPKPSPTTSPSHPGRDADHRRRRRGSGLGTTSTARPSIDCHSPSTRRWRRDWLKLRRRGSFYDRARVGILRRTAHDPTQPAPRQASRRAGHDRARASRGRALTGFGKRLDRLTCASRPSPVHPPGPVETGAAARSRRRSAGQRPERSQWPDRPTRADQAMGRARRACRAPSVSGSGRSP